MNALELPGASSHEVQAEAFHSQMRHLDNQIDTIFGPSRAELRRRAERYTHTHTHTHTKVRKKKLCKFPM